MVEGTLSTPHHPVRALILGITATAALIALTLINTDPSPADPVIATTLVANQHDRPSAVAFSSMQDGYALTSGSDGRYQLWSTHNQGVRWQGYATPLPENTAQQPSLIASPTDLVLESGAEAWRSTDDGRTWLTTTVVPAGESGGADALDAGSNHTGIRVRMSSDGDYYVSNDGASWEPVQVASILS